MLSFSSPTGYKDGVCRTKRLKYKNNHTAQKLGYHLAIYRHKLCSNNWRGAVWFWREWRLFLPIATEIASAKTQEKPLKSEINFNKESTI